MWKQDKGDIKVDDYFALLIPMLFPTLPDAENDASQIVIFPSRKIWCLHTVHFSWQQVRRATNCCGIKNFLLCIGKVLLIIVGIFLENTFLAQWWRVVTVSLGHQKYKPALTCTRKCKFANELLLMEFKPLSSYWFCIWIMSCCWSTYTCEDICIHETLVSIVEELAMTPLYNIVCSEMSHLWLHEKWYARTLTSCWTSTTRDPEIHSERLPKDNKLAASEF